MLYAKSNFFVLVALNIHKHITWPTETADLDGQYRRRV